MSFRGLAGAVVAVSLIVLLGYLTFVFFVVSVAPNAGALSLVLLSVIAGIATFFNPCAFPLLPGYLTYQLAEVGRRQGQMSGAFLYGGAVAAVGLTTFNLLLGGILAGLGTAFLGSLALAAEEPSASVRIFRGIVGVLLIALGLSHVTGRGLSFGFLEGVGHRFRVRKGTRATWGLYAYGFGYSAVGIGCGAPILAGLSVFAFSYGGFGATLTAFLIFSLTMGLLMIAVSTLPALAGGTSVRRLSRSTGRIQRIAGASQALVGLFLFLSAIYTDAFVTIFFPFS